MRTFLVILFAVVALGLGGAWVFLQSSPAGDAEFEVVASAPPPPPPPAPVVAVEDAAPAESAEMAMAESEAALEVLEDDESFAVAAAPAPSVRSAPAAPADEPIVATQSLADQFKSREVTYNRPPKTLALDHAIDVSLVINATGVAGAGAEALEGFEGEIVDRDVELTDIVSAQLTGPGFDIVSQTVDRQRLSPRVLNRWQWRVTPTKEGTQTLILEIFGYAEGAMEGEPLDAYRDVITVEVRNLDRVVSFARQYESVFAVGAGVAGALSALFGFLRFRGDRKKRAR